VEFTAIDGKEHQGAGKTRTFVPVVESLRPREANKVRGGDLGEVSVLVVCPPVYGWTRPLRASFVRGWRTRASAPPRVRRTAQGSVKAGNYSP
jgi:hypothetical protein